MAEASKENALTKSLMWAMQIDPDWAKGVAEGKRKANPGKSNRDIADLLIATYARKGAAEGFLTGLPTNPLVAVPGAMVDVATVLRFYAAMTAAIGYLANPKYFEDPDWKNDALLMFAGREAVSRAFREAGVSGAKQTSKVLIKKYLSKDVLKLIKKFVLKWFGKKVTQRAIIAKAVPLVGGLIGGTWNYVEVKMMGAKIIRYHFEEDLQ